VRRGHDRQHAVLCVLMMTKTKSLMHVLHIRNLSLSFAQPQAEACKPIPQYTKHANFAT